jgi:hypothetical protein
LLKSARILWNQELIETILPFSGFFKGITDLLLFRIIVAAAAVFAAPGYKECCSYVYQVQRQSIIVV